MINLTTTTPKELENVYLEFENSIAESILYSEHWSQDQQSDEPNNTMQMDESGLIYLTEPTNTPQYNLEKHIQELDKSFAYTINEIREHLINQFDGIEQSKIVSFFLKHKTHFKRYMPEGRETAIYKQFAAYCYFPDATPKNFSLTDNEKELLKLVYETYSRNYNNLNKVIEELKQEYLTGEPKAKPEFSLSEIALKYAYEGKAITEENSNEIAKSFGHNSGHKLKQHFDFFNSPTDRKAKRETKKKMENKIELFEKVIKVLPEQYKQKALDELKILKTIKENNDY